jgi:hypothetical protein
MLGEKERNFLWEALADAHMSSAMYSLARFGNFEKFVRLVSPVDPS